MYSCTLDRTLQDLQGDFFQLFDLKVEKTLGIGTSAEVVLASSVANPMLKRAVKKFSWNEDDDDAMVVKIKATFEKEVELMQQIQHPYLLYQFFAVRCPGYLAICMEYCPLGNLLSRVKDISKSMAERNFTQLVSAVTYLHEKRIVHSDIKLPNIFLNASEDAVLGDFGLSFRMNENSCLVTSCGGTVSYCAPEMFGDKDMDAFKLDVYALGIVTWSLLFNRRPSHKVNYMKEVKNSCGLTQCHRNYLSMMLRRNPDKRATMAQLFQEIKRNYRSDSDEENREVPMASLPGIKRRRLA